MNYTIYYWELDDDGGRWMQGETYLRLKDAKRALENEYPDCKWNRRQFSPLVRELTLIQPLDKELTLFCPVKVVRE